MKRSAGLILSLIALLAACTNTPQNSQPMNKDEAKATSELALSDLALSGALVGGPTGLMAQQAQALGIPPVAGAALEASGMNLAQAISAGCRIDVGGWTDQDLDLIPADFSITVKDCSYTDTGNGFSYSFQGGLRLQDTNDTLKDSGFKLSFENFKETITLGSKSRERTLNGAYTLGAQNKALYRVDKGYSASQKLSDGSSTDTQSAEYAVSETYAPNSQANPKAGGTFTIDKSKPGTLTLAHNSTTYRWNWYTDPPLVYDASCKAKTPEGVKVPFTSGGAVYTYTNPNGKVSMLKVEFTGCGSYKVTFEGEVVVQVP
ncbi:MULTISPECIES: hypothetical protein [unclassified Meiothermus]|uniref:hypothetical protein n=1 Tax=unclassified Meiothermus TaxID=370471 RepID=UPI000D7C2860|nr:MULTISPECIES: hypothetical protein [unclassified Meiothermus]PZA07609.1 hypothetical protein DNA98_08320 [Meiothermus sp. Pnk-1]RYM29411.1 hypothetical protein EWH23_16075 [Meiothermus sp. PNK-Is4]